MASNKPKSPIFSKWNILKCSLNYNWLRKKNQYN